MSSSDRRIVEATHILELLPSRLRLGVESGHDDACDAALACLRQAAREVRLSSYTFAEGSGEIRGFTVLSDQIGDMVYLSVETPLRAPGSSGGSIGFMSLRPELARTLHSQLGQLLAESFPLEESPPR